jgi:large subunit ribosomal protein L10
MSRSMKERMVGEYEQRFSDVADVAVVNTEGIDANQMVALRATLRRRGIRAMRVQNRLARRAVQEGPLAGADVLFDGPTTLVWGGDSIVDIAKVLTDEAKELQQLEIRGGFSGGAVLTKRQMQDLSEMPSREELIGQIVGRAVGQAARIVSLATAPASGLLAQIREIEKQGPAEAAEPAGETPAAAEEAPAETDKASGEAGETAKEA